MKAEKLRDDPYPRGFKKLAGQDRCQIRRGDYRILYTVDDVRVLVEVFKVGHRSNVYCS
ncbi:MAG: type II toxin-antitoxin system RelE/ParE family toxin [Lysobacterales bacterium]